MRNGFNLLIRDHMGLIDEKTEGRKSQESSATVQICPALCDTALDHCPAQSKSTKVSSHAAFFKETIYPKIIQR
jgi:hypothetical protein